MKCEMTVGMLLCALVVGCGDAGTATSKASAAASAGAETPVVDVTPAQLVKAYEDNTVAADDLYKGKRLRIAGRIEEIATGITDEPYLVMRVKGAFVGPQLHFDKEARSAIARLKKGQQVTVVCTGAGDVAKIPMNNDCTLQQ